MLPSGAVPYPSFLIGLDVINPPSQSSPSVSVTPGPTTDTTISAGTSLPLSSTFSSNSDVSRSLTSPSTAIRVKIDFHLYSDAYFPNIYYGNVLVTHSKLITFIIPLYRFVSTLQYPFSELSPPLRGHHPGPGIICLSNFEVITDD
ncbi:hypothetical protein V8E55_007380 [Tylopilus felleus]